jgi:hypothetical protein
MERTLFLSILLVFIILLVGCNSQQTPTKDESSLASSETYRYNSGTKTGNSGSYDIGYQWAKDKDINNFSDCQHRFGTGNAEDGCNAYVKDNYTGYKTFHDYECTEDCSGHEAGYAWAEKNGITEPEDCSGKSQSFIEGCEAYANEN